MPNCRGRHPHLPSYASADDPCQGEVRLMLLGAANQWFPATVSVLVLPSRKVPQPADTVSEVIGLPPSQVGEADLTRLRAGWAHVRTRSHHRTLRGISTKISGLPSRCKRNPAAARLGCGRSDRIRPQFPARAEWKL